MSGLFSTHLLSLDALLAVIDSIEQHCHHRVINGTKSLAAVVANSTAIATSVAREAAAKSTEGEQPPDGGWLHYRCLHYAFHNLRKRKRINYRYK